MPQLPLPTNLLTSLGDHNQTGDLTHSFALAHHMSLMQVRLDASLGHCASHPGLALSIFAIRFTFSHKGRK